jgi:hypothetical protein
MSLVGATTACLSMGELDPAHSGVVALGKPAAVGDIGQVARVLAGGGHSMRPVWFEDSQENYF